MKCIIAGFVTIFSCSVFASECPPPPAACCASVPPAWHLGIPFVVSAFQIGAGGNDEVTAFIKSINAKAIEFLVEERESLLLN